MSWIYKGEVFEFDIESKYVAFVYLITCLETNKKYVGKKFLTRKQKKTYKKKRNKIVIVESDWKNYFGSSNELLEDVKRLGEKSFKREILHLCLKRSHANFLELKEQIDRNVLFRDDYYNSFIGTRIQKSHVKDLYSEN